MTDKVDIQKVLSKTNKPYDVTIKASDACLYSLTIGFQQDPLNKDHLKFSYENDDSFQPFPTNALTVCHRGPFSTGDFDVPGIPPFNPMMLLHGEEEITVHKPLEIDTKYTVSEKLVDFQDKGKGGLLIIDSLIKNEKGELQSVVRTSLFIRGAGGFGHKGTIKS